METPIDTLLSIDKVPTGIKGLDKITRGGLSRSATLVWTVF